METVKCEHCKKNITKEVKYSHNGLFGWYCSKCYFKGQFEVNDNDLNKSKVKFSYENR